MIVYEVNLHIDAIAADEYAEWLGPHIEQILDIEGFRNVGVFHEDVTNKIIDDFRLACKPRRVDVIGRFNSRGGISTNIEVHWSE